MKATQRDYATVSRRAAGTASIFYFCGPDEAGASAAAKALVGMLEDPGERIDLAGNMVRQDPALLGDEARSSSLFGSTRHLWVRAQGDDVHAGVQALLETLDAGQDEICPIIIVATGATDKSRTAKLLEKRKDALVAMFWPPDLGSVTGSVRAMADAAGLRLSGDLAQRIARAANLDVRLAQSEIDKLALYCDAAPQSPVSVAPEALDAIGAASEEDGFMPLVNAVLSGETKRLAPELQRMRQVSLNPVGVLLAVERRVAQLSQLNNLIGPTGNIDAVLEQEKRARRVFFKDVRDLSNQLRRWRGPKLERLTARVIALHQQLLSNSQAAELLLAQGLTDITRAAAAGKRR